MSNFKPDENFIRLCDAVFDEQASSTEIEQLEAQVLNSPEHRKYYAQRAFEHASLTILANDLNNSEHDESIPETLSVPKTKDVKYRFSFYQALSAMTLGLLVGLGLWWFNYQQSTFATIQSMKNVDVVNSDFPLNLFSRVGKGQIHLKAGILTILFDSHATLVIEGPADLEIVDALTCNLYKGRVVSSMPKGESGFVVTTPYASFHDLGTKFGVSVSSYGVAEMQVIEGEVDAKHLTSGAEIRLREGDTVQSTLNKFYGRVTDLNNEESSLGINPVASLNKIIRISTNLGKGKDTTIIRDPEVFALKQKLLNYSKEVLMLKNCIEAKRSFDRKIYLSFDTTALGNRKVLNAGFNLYLMNTEIGYASRCPDSRFTVYGVKEEFEKWPDDMNWQNAPANIDASDAVDLGKAINLGEFVIPQGTQEGLFSIKTQELTDFINQNTNKQITLIVVRNTREFETGGTVHCFASSQTLQGIPPTLLMEVEDTK